MGEIPPPDARARSEYIDLDITTLDTAAFHGDGQIETLLSDALVLTPSLLGNREISPLNCYIMRVTSRPAPTLLST
jgi:predicted oxidoreductase